MIHLFPLVRHSLLLLFLLSGLTSCMKEDFSDCPPVTPSPLEVENRIQLSFIPYSEVTGEGFEAAELESVTVFAFDTEGRFVAKVTDNAPRLGDADYYVSLPLLPGLYDFYVWGNVHDCYAFTCTDFIKEETLVATTGLDFGRPSNDTLTVSPHPLFFASLEDVEVKPFTRADIVYQELTLPLVKNTYNVDFELSGLDESILLGIVVTDNNSSYGFDNSFLNCDYMHYTSPCVWKTEDDVYRSSLTTLRLDRKRSPRFKLYNQTVGKLIYHEDLIDLILSSEEISGKQIDFSRQYNFKIVVSFSKEIETGEISINISVNGWHVVEQKVTVDLSKPNI